MHFLAYSFKLISFFTFLIYCNATTNSSLKCNEKVFERCVNAMLVNSDETFVYPTNLRELNATCKLVFCFSYFKFYC